MELEYFVFDYLDCIREWFYQLIIGFRKILFGLSEFRDIREFCLFFFVTIPIIFADFEKDQYHQ